jgi:hypothetical protein
MDFCCEIKPWNLVHNERYIQQREVICQYQNYEFKCQRWYQFLQMLENWYQRKIKIYTLNTQIHDHSLSRLDTDRKFILKRNVCTILLFYFSAESPINSLIKSNCKSRYCVHELFGFFRKSVSENQIINFTWLNLHFGMKSWKIYLLIVKVLDCVFKENK